MADNDKDSGLQTLNNNKIGIIGGTFDPIHFGHLFIAQTALDKLELNKIVFIPTGRPPHKKQNSITNSCNRMDMLNLAVKSNSKFEVSSIEVAKEKICYTIDTIKELQQYYGEKMEIYFIMGADSFLAIESWKEYKQLLTLSKFIVTTRNTLNDGPLDRQIELITKECGAHITKIDIPNLDISSTDIKKRIKEGNSIKYLLPESVEGYIFNNKLYMD